jgi:hypothetical protein
MKSGDGPPNLIHPKYGSLKKMMRIHVAGATIVPALLS